MGERDDMSENEASERLDEAAERVERVAERVERGAERIEEALERPIERDPYPPRNAPAPAPESYVGLGGDDDIPPEPAKDDDREAPAE